jgi:hypothetical protein
MPPPRLLGFPREISVPAARSFAGVASARHDLSAFLRQTDPYALNVAAGAAHARHLESCRRLPEAIDGVQP